MPSGWSPWVILLAVVIYGLVHSWLASLQAKALAQRAFGIRAARFYRLAYNLFAALTLLPVLALAAALPDQSIYIIPFPWVLVTTAIQLLSALVIVVGIWQTGLWSFIGLGQLARPQDDQPPKMVTHGLYRWVRHPLYTAGLVLIWLSPVMTRNLLVLLASLSLYLVIGAVFEERKLVREFGQAYQSYRINTPMLIPRPPKKT